MKSLLTVFPLLFTAILAQTNNRLDQNSAFESSKPPSDNTPAANSKEASDTDSVDSLDSLESEQPSSRSHMIKLGNTGASSINNNSSSGSGTYRQESPSVLINGFSSQAKNDNPNKQPETFNVGGTGFKASTKETAYNEPDSFVGFQVVEGKHGSHTTNKSRTTAAPAARSHQVPQASVVNGYDMDEDLRRFGVLEQHKQQQQLHLQEQIHQTQHVHQQQLNGNYY